MIENYVAPFKQMPVAPVLDRVQRPQFDNRGSVQAMRQLGQSFVNLGQANQVPQLPANYGQAVPQGIQALGKGIEQFGNEIHNMQMFSAKVRNQRQVAEAQGVANGIEAEFDAWRAQPENAMRPDTWEKGYQRISESRWSQWEGSDNFAPAVRDAVYNSRVRTQPSRALRVQTMVAKQEARLLGDSLDSQWRLAIEGKDAAQMSRTVDQMVANGLTTPDRAELMKVEGVNRIQSANDKDISQTMAGLRVEGKFAEANEAAQAISDPEIRRYEIAKNNSDLRVESAYQTALDNPYEAHTGAYERDKKGNFINHPELTIEERASYASFAGRAMQSDRDKRVTDMNRALLDKVYGPENYRESELYQGADPEQRNRFDQQMLRIADAEAVAEKARIEEAEGEMQERTKYLTDIHDSARNISRYWKEAYDLPLQQDSSGKWSERSLLAVDDLRTRMREESPGLLLMDDGSVEAAPGYELAHEAYAKVDQILSERLSRNPDQSGTEVMTEVGGMAQKYLEQGSFGDYLVRADALELATGEDGKVIKDAEGRDVIRTFEPDDSIFTGENALRFFTPPGQAITLAQRMMGRGQDEPVPVREIRLSLEDRKKYFPGDGTRVEDEDLGADLLTDEFAFNQAETRMLRAMANVERLVKAAEEEGIPMTVEQATEALRNEVRASVRTSKSEEAATFREGITAPITRTGKGWSSQFR